MDEIRLKYGAKNANDTSIDNLINKRTNTELIEDWCAWKLGYPDWWCIMKLYYDMLQQIDPD